MTLAFAQKYIGTNLPAAIFEDWPVDFLGTQYWKQIWTYISKLKFKLFWWKTPDLNILNWFIYGFMKFE